jgi:Lon protease-like protein
MFPLGTVLLPGAVLPLHDFEPRYRALLADCLAGEPEFGVVLIERGREVGGGDVRRTVGTVARILEVAEMADGRSAVVAVGTRRITVNEWMAEEPYPTADVDDWPDGEGDDDAGGPRLAAVLGHLRRVLALQTELGDPSPPVTTEVSDDPVLATYHASALAPLGPDDHYQLLAAVGPAARLTLLDRFLDEAEDRLRFRIS